MRGKEGDRRLCSIEELGDGLIVCGYLVVMNV